MQLQPKTATLTDSPKLGNFAEQLWGISASVITYRHAATTVTARVRGAAEHLGQDVGQDRHQLGDALTHWWRRARRTSGARADQEVPIPGYDEMTASKIIERLAKLSQQQLASLEEYERSHADRVTVLKKIRSLRE